MQHVEHILCMYNTIQTVRNVFFPEYHYHLYSLHNVEKLLIILFMSYDM
jgi:hypothetical protein